MSSFSYIAGTALLCLAPYAEPGEGMQFTSSTAETGSDDAEGGVEHLALLPAAAPQ